MKLGISCIVSCFSQWNRASFGTILVKLFKFFEEWNAILTIIMKFGCKSLLNNCFGDLILYWSFVSMNSELDWSKIFNDTVLSVVSSSQFLKFVDGFEHYQADQPVIGNGKVARFLGNDIRGVWQPMVISANDGTMGCMVPGNRCSWVLLVSPRTKWGVPAGAL